MSSPAHIPRLTVEPSRYLRSSARPPSGRTTAASDPVTGFLGFLGGWTEYLTTYYFIGGNPQNWTLAIALNSMVGQFARTTPWSEFAAFAILFALPVSLVFFFFQRYLVGGLAVGGVKG